MTAALPLPPYQLPLQQSDSCVPKSSRAAHLQVGELEAQQETMQVGRGWPQHRRRCQRRQDRHAVRQPQAPVAEKMKIKSRLSEADVLVDHSFLRRN